MTPASEDGIDLLSVTADIVSAQVANNAILAVDVPRLITNVYEALAGLGKPVLVTEEPQKPAVSVRSSVKHDYIVCLEDGKKLKMLKRHLMTDFGLTPDAYRAKWNLPADYPMVAPAYAEQRRMLANAIGLGRNGRVAKAVAAGEAPKRRGRKPKAPLA